MRTAPGVHPAEETLAAYGLGKADEATAASVAGHLESCPACRERVAELSADGFVGRLREGAGGKDRTPKPEKSLSGLANTTPRTPGSTPPVPAPLESAPPELASNPDYTDLRELGRGGMGVVYLARNALMDRLEVLKVMGADSVRVPGAEERFLREIRSAAQLSHPNVVRAYAAARMGESLVFSMEYVPGEDLARVVERTGPLPVVNACYYVQQVARGLQHAHEKGMVHRDIKPANLMLAKDGKQHTVKVLDFGLAKATSEQRVDADLTGTGKMMGTPTYMAPEQALDAARADIRADIYSLGCTLYFLLAGRAPFAASNLFVLLHHHQGTEAQSLNLMRPDVPVELAGVAAKMMAKDPRDRYQTPGEVAKALAPFLKTGTATKSAPDVSLDRSMLSAPPSPARPAPLAPVAPPSTVPESDWETLGTGSPTKSPARNRPRTAAPTPQRSKRRVWLWPTVAAGVVLLALLAAWGGGVFKVKTKDGTIVLENLPPNAEVVVDGETVTVTRNGEQATVKLNTGGPHKLKVVLGGRDIYSDDLTVNIGGEPIRVRVEKAVANAPPNAPSAAPKVEPPAEPKVAADGFVPLFNGKDLTGWAATDGTAPEWDVRDGYIEVAGKQGIRTRKDVGMDFELHAEFWLPLMPDKKGQARANSGIFLHGRYEVQILDSYMNDTFPDGAIGALYRLITPDPDALKRAIRKPETWNAFDITFHSPRVDEKGALTKLGHITVALNGVVVINDVTFDKVTAGATDQLIGRPGPIALQHHGDKVRFRKIEIKELAAPTAADAAFVPLFNGKDLTGWKTHSSQPGKWRVENGVLIGSGPGATSHLYTQRDDYKDFHLRTEARVNEGGNSGVYCRAPFGPVHPAMSPRWLVGYNAKLDKQRFGGLIVDGVNTTVVREGNPALPAGQWVVLEVIAEGNHIVIKVNGEVTADYTDEKKSFASGHIALQQHTPSTLVEFKTIEIKELMPK